MAVSKAESSAPDGLLVRTARVSNRWPVPDKLIAIVLARLEFLDSIYTVRARICHPEAMDDNQLKQILERLEDIESASRGPSIEDLLESILRQMRDANTNLERIELELQSKD